MRAIISVANREGIIGLGRELQTHGVSIYSTSGTASVLEGAGVETQTVNTLTGFPEILDGRVKTLHPAILGVSWHNATVRRICESCMNTISRLSIW